MHVVVVKCRQRNVQKGLMHREQNDCFWLGFVDTMLAAGQLLGSLRNAIWYDHLFDNYVNFGFRGRRGAASLRYRNRAKITVLMCEQKPYPRWFLCRRKSYYPAQCDLGLSLVCSVIARKRYSVLVNHQAYSYLSMYSERILICLARVGNMHSDTLFYTSSFYMSQSFAI